MARHEEAKYEEDRDRFVDRYRYPGIAVIAGPKISVDNAVYDFGEVLEGIAVIHTFILSNVGDESLAIEQVHTSCGCTTTAVIQEATCHPESPLSRDVVR